MPPSSTAGGPRLARDGMTVEEVRALPVVVPMLDAARVFGMGERAARARYKAGEFPVRVFTVGPGWLRCNRADILRAIGEPVGSEAPREATR